MASKPTPADAPDEAEVLPDDTQQAPPAGDDHGEDGGPGAGDGGGRDAGQDRPDAKVSHGVPQHAPRQEMSGAIADTTEDNFSAPGSRPGVATSAGDNEFHVLRLATFLRENFPHQVGRTDGVSTEHPVDVAMRLLQGLTSSQPAGERCHDQYCNKPVGHSDDHGWVEYTQS